MSDPNFILLYVCSPSKSVEFYAKLLGKRPIQESPTFAMFALDSGVMLGLWGAPGVQPAATPAGGGELAFTVDGRDAVQATHRAWQAAGLQVIQAPTAMDFGFTFTALDPDGHRLRVFAPSGQ
jgi:predicted enzyme related to lactoylglutathione lyase